MYSDKILLLGYPVDELPREHLQERIASLIDNYRREHRTHFATTLSALFLGQLSSCNLNHPVRVEAVESLHLADLIGLDSPLLQLLAKYLGQKLPPRVNAKDLLFATADLLARRKEAIYLVGGDESLCHRTADALKADYPGLKIAGIGSPSIYTKGERLEDSLERDLFIVDAINEAKPTVLVLQLGHPKQELWFQRIKDYLKIPLVVGIGGGFESYLKQRSDGSKRAAGDQAISWSKLRRRIVSTIHYLSWIPPLLLYNSINRLLKANRSAEKGNIEKRFLFLAEKESLTVLPFPSSTEGLDCKKISEWMDEALDLDNIVLDFSTVKHMDLRSLGLLYQMWKQCFRMKKNFLILGVSEDIKWLMKLHGAWDFVDSHICSDAEDVLDRLSINSGISLKREREFVCIQQVGNDTHLNIFGRLHGINTYPHSLRQLAPILEQRGCIVNLAYCSHITQRGLGFLLKLREHQAKQRQKLVLEHASKGIIYELSETNLKHLFQFG